VARTANLWGYARVSLAGLTIVGRFQKRRSWVGPRAMNLAGQASQPTAGSRKVFFSKSTPVVWAAAALERPVPLIQRPRERRPACGSRCCMNGATKKAAVLFYDVALFPLAADRVSDFFKLGMKT